MSLLRPDDVIAHVHDITPEFLAARGLRGLLLDLDNTLIPYGSYEERADVMHWAAELRRAGIRLYLLSNATSRRARFWIEKLGFEGIGMAGKPNPRAFRRALSQLGLPPQQVGMVGDQLFTDVLGGNLAGMHTILVRPLAVNALPHTRAARRLERAVLKRYGHDWRP
ncbi:YqeG family HAD IIIA-type phosphatase [Deinococcus sp. YIM 77859]|uniref:YqeG family HAD IIIA-type phosphatase n=1 Tax=Deinococcus sp. YIM 77859 TaxID=1540221 RepID=UPI000552ACA1|nr:YqeG family HAD IIIA-type phosphatase [Deinococcus sp. YIM 77859]